jgi:hypothetical protein
MKRAFEKIGIVLYIYGCAATVAMGIDEEYPWTIVFPIVMLFAGLILYLFVEFMEDE